METETAPQPRLWPLVVILVLQVVTLGISITPSIQNLQRFLFMMGGPLLCALLFLVWLHFASRLRRSERWTITAVFLLLPVLSGFVAHTSTRTVLLVHGLPLVLLTLGLGLILGRRRAPGARVRLALLLAVASCVPMTLLRTDGFDGSYRPEYSLRWTPTPEEELLARAPTVEDRPPAPEAVTLRPGDWPGFRGAERNSRVRGVRIETDWEAAAPRELWRVAIGPGWGSFTHVGGYVFTQEQRGEEEVVLCYDAETGAELWRVGHPTRFVEVVSGAGPRATPTFADGRLYVLGAKGALACHEAKTGAVLWKRELVEDFGSTVPIWGFSSSPLVTHGLVLVYIWGTDGRGLMAFDATNGEEAWYAPGTGENYASAQLVTLDGVELVLFTNENGLLALDPPSGEIVWEFTPSAWKTAPLIQPQQVGESALVVAVGDGMGLARLDVEHTEGRWSVTERWSSRRLKPAFNDFVYFEGHLYGFDQSNFSCVDFETGGLKWRGGRYGFGQVLLLEESTALLVSDESGEVVLLAADPEELRELGRAQPLDGKTWNHPVVVGDRLYVRNGEEAVCLQLPVVVPDR